MINDSKNPAKLESAIILNLVGRVIRKIPIISSGQTRRGICTKARAGALNQLLQQQVAARVQHRPLLLVEPSASMGFGPFGKSERQRAAEEQMLNTSSKQHAENADETIDRLVKKSDEIRAQMIAIRDSAKRSGVAGLPVYQKKQLQYLHGELMRIDKQLEHSYSIKSKYSDMSLAVQQSKDVAYIGKNIKEATKDMKINQKKVNLEKITAYQTEFDMNKMQVESVTDMVFQQEEFIDDEILFDELGLGDLNDLSTVQASAPQLQDTNIARQEEQLIIGSDLDLGTGKMQNDVEPKKKVDSLGVPL